MEGLLVIREVESCFGEILGTGVVCSSGLDVSFFPIQEKGPEV